MSRLAGNSGAVYLKTGPSTFTKVLDVLDWTFGADTTLLRCDIKGDAIERWVPSHASGVKFTAKRRHQGASVFLPAVADSASNSTQTTWRLDMIDNNSSFVQITCNGYAESSSVNSPQGEAIEETFTLQVDDSYTVSH